MQVPESQFLITVDISLWNAYPILTDNQNIVQHGRPAYSGIGKHPDTTAADTSTAPFIYSLKALGICFISLLYHQNLVLLLPEKLSCQRSALKINLN